MLNQPTDIPPLPAEDPTDGTIHWNPWTARRHTLEPCPDCGATAPPNAAQGATQQCSRPPSTAAQWCITHTALHCTHCGAVRTYRVWNPRLGNIRQLIRARPPLICVEPGALPPAPGQPPQPTLF